MSKRHLEIAMGLSEAGRPLAVRVEFSGWFSHQVTELRADEWGLTATGDLGGYRRGTLRLAWEKVAELHYAPPGQGMVEGLYVREGLWCSRCLLPRLDEIEAEAVIAAVCRQYPHRTASLESVRIGAIAEEISIDAGARHSGPLGDGHSIRWRPA